MNAKADTRLDVRLSQEQKALFEKASELGGYKSLSEFVLAAARLMAEPILEKNRQILASEEDRRVFCEALLHPVKPNAALRRAAQRYRKMSDK